MKQSIKTKYAYILAASHSGSTLLAMLLNSHPDVATVGELTSGAHRTLDGYRCSCRELLTECRFWRTITAAMQQHHPAFNLSNFGIQFEVESPRWLARLLRIEHRGRFLEACRDAVLALSPSWRRHFARTAATCEELAGQVLGLSGARVLVDSSKLAHRLKFVRRIAGLDLKVIHLVRDGRAVALTYMDTDNFADSSDPSLRRGGRGPDGPPQQRTLHMEHAADEWRRSVRSAEFALACLDRTQWMQVRYEDLCSRPDETLARIIAFLELDPAKIVKPFRAVEHHVVGNGMRMDSGSEIRLDERWKSVLDESDLATFERIAGAMNRRYSAAPVESCSHDYAANLLGAAGRP
jgi:hypothetical protein